MAHRQMSGTGYVFTWMALLALTTLSFGLSYGHLGVTADMAISLGIALVKTLLVLFLFMHLIEQRASSQLVVLTCVVLLAILVTLTAADVATRHTFPPRPEPLPTESP